MVAGSDWNRADLLFCCYEKICCYNPGMTEQKDSPPLSIPYATPGLDPEKKLQALILMILFLVGGAVLIFLISGVSWQAVAAIACLSAACIAAAFVLTRI